MNEIDANLESQRDPHIKGIVLIGALMASVASCGGKATPAPENRGASDSTSALILTETGLGPVDGKTKATVEDLHQRLPRYEVGHGTDPLSVGPKDVVVADHGERQLIVVAGEDGNVEELFLIGARIGTSAGWRVGETLSDTTKLVGCECRADGIGCYGHDSHLEVLFAENCMVKIEDAVKAGKSPSDPYRELFDGKPAALATLKGRPISGVYWSRKVFGAPLGDAGNFTLPPSPPSP